MTTPKRVLIPDGLVLDLRPGDGSPLAQRGRVLDRSGKGNHGQLYGSPALDFDGGADWAEPASRFDWKAGHRHAALRFSVKPTATGLAQCVYNDHGPAEYTLVVETGNSGSVSVSADTTAGGDGSLRTAGTGDGVLTMGAWNHCLLVVDAQAAKLYLWVNGVVKANGIAFSGAFDHTTFQAGTTPTTQWWGRTADGDEPLKAAMTCMAVAGLDALPADQDAQAIYENPVGSLGAAGGITWDAWYRCAEGTGATVDNGQGTASRDLSLSGVSWNVTGANLGNAWRDAAGSLADSFATGGRGFPDGEAQGYFRHWLQVADAASLSFGNAGTDLPFSLVVWAAVPAFGTDLCALLYKWATNKQEWGLSMGADGKLIFFLAQSNNPGNRIGKYSAGSYDDGTLRMYAATYVGDKLESGINVYVNGAADNGASFSSGTYPGLTDNDAPLCVRAVGVNGAGSSPADGYNRPATFRRVQIFNRALTAREVAALYAQGALA